MAKEKVKLFTPPFRALFINVWEPTSFEGKGDKKYNLVAVFNPSKYTGKDKERWDALKALMDTECLRVFKKTWADCRKSEEDGGVEGFKPGLRDGSKGKKKDREGFGPGTWFATLSSKYPPGVIGPDKKDITADHNADLIYDGIWARAQVGVYAYDNVSSGVSIGLNALQKLKDGTKIISQGGGADALADDDVDSSFLDEIDEPPVGDDDIPF